MEENDNPQEFHYKGTRYFKEIKFFRKTGNRKAEEISEETFYKNKKLALEWLENRDNAYKEALERIRNKIFPKDKGTTLDLFCGPGGLSYGFKQAGFEAIAAFDLHFQSCQTYRTNIKETTVIEYDISKVDPKEIPLEKGKLDVIIGGPPCQGFSVISRAKIKSLIAKGIWEGEDATVKKVIDIKKWTAQGKREVTIVTSSRFIDDPRNLLYKKFVEFIDFFKPKVFLMENVPGLYNFQDGLIKKQILADFRSLGYEVDVKILNAVNFGVPQNRRRVFFLGNRIGVLNQFPKPTHAEKDSSSNHIVLDNFLEIPETFKLENAITLEDAISDLDFIKAGEGSDEQDYQQDYPARSPYQIKMREKSNFIFNHYARRLTIRDKEIFENLKPGGKYKDLDIKFKVYGNGDSFGDKMYRLPYNKPCRTIVAHLEKDGYMYIHPTTDRTITVREAARVQSFPDTFRFMGSRTKQFKQVGNAVPPLLARVLANSIKKMLSKSREEN